MNKEKLKKFINFDFLILCLSWYLAYYMIDYGWDKIIGNQFGVFKQEILDLPLKDVDKFYLAWHLFSLSNLFNVVVGSFQILGGILIIINRWRLIGSLLLLPILFQILLIDLSYTTNMFGLALPIRLGGMIVADLIVLYYGRAQLKEALQVLIRIKIPNIKFEWWVLVFMPIVGFAMDFVIGLFIYPIQLLLEYFIYR